MMRISCLFYTFRYKIIKEIVQVDVSGIQLWMAGTHSTCEAMYNNIAQLFRTGGKDKLCR